MMIRKVKSLDEDFKAIGLAPESAADMGMGLIAEDTDDAEKEEVVDEGKKKTCEGDNCPPMGDDDEEEEEGEEEEEEEEKKKETKKEDEDSAEDDLVIEGDEGDALDSPEVNMEMLDAIAGLPISEMDTDDIADVLEALKEKVLPGGDDELAERAEEIVDVLVMEAVAKKTRRAKAGSMAKKASFQCPEGTRKDPKDPAGRRCIKAAKAAGGAGKLAKQNRKKTRWSKSGSGKKSEKKSGRWAARREDEDVMSPFALELAGLLEGNDVEVGHVVTVRGEIVDRLGSIMDMLHEEFLDEDVTSVMEGVYESITDAMDAGSLDEGIVGEEEFIAEMKPALQLIAKSLGQIDQNEGSDLGNESAVA